MTAETRAYLDELCRVISKTVDTEAVYLFGSHAYGTPREDSDFDLCVLIRDDSLRPVDAIKKIRRALFLVQRTPLDVIVYHISSFREQSVISPFERKILGEGVLLYERQPTGQRLA